MTVHLTFFRLHSRILLLILLLSFSVIGMYSYIYIRTRTTSKGEEPSTKITVDAKDVIGTIDRNVYGHFIEHIDGCIYPGIWVGEDSPINNTGGIRTDTLKVVKAIEPPIIRWPGGNFASGYHWKDGIGPRDKRPVRPNLAWGGTESNQFGTDEFMDFCRLIGAEPYICVNVGSGTPEEAAQWVEYCNGNVSTTYGSLRAENGHPEPYNVKYWGIGNEMYGSWQIGYMNADDYAQAVIRFSQAMRKVDPTIKLIAVGEYGSDEWNRKVLEVAADYFDYLSVHVYYDADGGDYYTVVACPIEAERTLNETSRLIDSTMSEKQGKEAKIALDEWNVWYADSSLALRDGLFAAGMFNVFNRLCNNVTMANLAQLVNFLPAIVTDYLGRIYETPIYLAFKLYVENTGDIALKTQTNVETYQLNKLGIRDVPFLDCSATMDENGTSLYLAVINRHKDLSMETRIELKNFTPQEVCLVSELNARNVTTRNTFLYSDDVKITAKSVNIEGSVFNYTFPPHSVTILKFKSKGVLQMDIESETTNQDFIIPASSSGRPNACEYCYTSDLITRTDQGRKELLQHD